MVGQQRQQTPELQFDKFPHSTFLFLCWKIQIQESSDYNEVEMVNSLEELKSSRSVSGKNFPTSEMLDAKSASALNKIIENSQFKKKVSLEEQKAKREDEEDRSPS